MRRYLPSNSAWANSLSCKEIESTGQPLHQSVCCVCAMKNIHSVQKNLVTVQVPGSIFTLLKEDGFFSFCLAYKVTFAYKFIANSCNNNTWVETKLWCRFVSLNDDCKLKLRASFRGRRLLLAADAWLRLATPADLDDAWWRLLTLVCAKLPHTLIKPHNNPSQWLYELESFI